MRIQGRSRLYYALIYSPTGWRGKAKRSCAVSEQSFDPNSLFKQPAISLPCRLFETINRMDEYSAEDMRYGDLSEFRLKNDFKLRDVSARVNPYTGERITASRYNLFNHRPSQPLSVKESADILFDEFRELSRVFSFVGPYRDLIEKLITHMQTGNGKVFRSHLLDSAYKNQIVNDSSRESSLLKIKKSFSDFINWDLGRYDSKNKSKISINILDSVIPKFNKWVDRINSLTISVHDVWATHITLKSLLIEGDNYSATIHYRAQDHFGLDSKDVLNPVYRQFRIFRIWFLLQHYEKYSYKPFITEINASISIKGSRYDQFK
ncbi:DUF3289 family protein [Erwinia sp. J316]|uniref:DUF3289 family protein n=1 Tax=Erwinia sorbitola TaxID=2681984 RepID=A0ABW9R845_9GAMM|nr:DUF3289 family protein [Erwinia sorbitola]